MQKRKGLVDKVRKWKEEAKTQFKQSGRTFFVCIGICYITLISFCVVSVLMNVLEVQVTCPNEWTIAANWANDGSDDLWQLDERELYRWKDWKMIRAENSLLIWSKGVVLNL